MNDLPPRPSCAPSVRRPKPLYGRFRFAFENRPARITVPKVETETVATMPSDRTRKKIGVGEKVNLTMTPASIGSVTWSVAGGGKIDPKTGTTTTFTAGARKATSTVTATFNSGAKCDTVFTVVEPSGARMIRKPGTGIFHIQGFLKIGFKGIPFLRPTGVSFENIQVRERRVKGEGTGYLKFLDGQVHKPALKWEDVVPGDDDASGSRIKVTDTVELKTSRKPPFTDGFFVWPIPWEYRVGGAPPKDFATVNQTLTVAPTEKITASKAGINVTVNASDPSSSY